MDMIVRACGRVVVGGDFGWEGEGRGGESDLLSPRWLAMGWNRAREGRSVTPTN